MTAEGILARNRRTHLVNDGSRTECGLRLVGLAVERGPVSRVTCRTCRRHLVESL